MLTAELALSDAARAEAFALRYVQYRQLGTIPEMPSGQFRDAFDDLEHTRILVVRNEEAVIVATLRLMTSGGSGEPLVGDELFADELRALPHSPAAPIHEVTRMAVANDYRNNPEPVYRLFGLMAWLALEDNPSYALAPTRRRQALSYIRLLGMSDLAPERFSPSQQVMLSLVGAPYETVFAHATRRYRNCFPAEPRTAESVA